MQTAALSGLAASAKPGWRANGMSTEGEKTAGTEGLTQCVDVFTGTGGHGHTYPGNPYTKSCFSHAQIAQGGKIVLRIGAQPNEKFGAAVEDRPPSFA